MDKFFESIINIYTSAWDVINNHPWIAALAVTVGIVAGMVFSRQLDRMRR